MPGQGDYPLLSSWLTRRGRGRLLYDASPLSGTGQNLKTAWSDWFFEANASGLTLAFTGVLSDGDTLFAPAVGLNLQPNLLSDGDTLYAPAVGLNLQPNLLSDGDTLYAPVVGGAASTAQPLRKPSPTLRLGKSRAVRDIYLNRRFKVEARFPGGRTIVVAKTATRERAFSAALHEARPQTSITAAGGSLSYTTDPTAGSTPDFERNNTNVLAFEP